MSNQEYSQRVYTALDIENKGYLVKRDLLKIIYENGLEEHGQLKELIKYIDSRFESQPINFKQFDELLSCNSFFKKALQEQLIISGFTNFKQFFIQCSKKIFIDDQNQYQSGNLATYIPGLAKANPDLWSAAFVSVDCQVAEDGDVDQKFSAQSIIKVFFQFQVVTYAYLYELIGEEIHNWVGSEPSGMVFNAKVLDANNKPHNPMINAGAIMICALLVKHNKKIEDIVNFLSRCTSNYNIEVDYDLAQEEKITAYSNLALLYLMLSKNSLPLYGSPHENLKKAQQALDLYLQCCCILVDTKTLAKFGACLASKGICVISGERIMSPETISSVVPIMVTCGMYNGAGQFAKEIGLPCKSGVSGGLLVVIPGIGSIGVFGPKLNQEGNSTKGIHMVKLLSSKYSNFNLFIKDQYKLDLTRKVFTTKIITTILACESSAIGDIDRLQRLLNQNCNLNEGDYDRRTPLHIASANSQVDTVQFLIQNNVDVNALDRWSFTPLDDAKDPTIIKMLEKNGAVRTKNIQNFIKLQESSVNDDFYRLVYAAMNENIMVLITMLTQNCKINNYDYDGRTALGVAASEGKLEAVKYLVNHGANIYHRDSRGNNSIDDAIREGHQEVSKYLQQIKQ